MLTVTSRPMEIVHVTGRYPPHLGGAELVAQRLAETQSHSHRVTVYTSRAGATGQAPRQRDGRLTVVRDPYLPVANTPLLPRLLPRLLRHDPAPDVIHVHAGFAGMHEAVTVAARLRRLPYVVHVHLMVRPSSAAGTWLLPIYQRSLYRRFVQGAAQVICLTDDMAQRVVDACGVPSERVSVVPNGVDPERFAPGDFADRAAGELLFIGRLTAQKNVTLLVEAMAALPADVCLTLVGAGELQEQLQRRIDELGLRNVRLAGRLAPEQLAVLYRQATAVVLPSTHEGFPLVLLEALSAGAPVVCSALPELIEAGGDAVVPVAPLTADRLAEVLRGLLADAPRRERLSAIGRQRASGFAWPVVAALIESVYRRAGVAC